jgi:hypothetical protein
MERRVEVPATVLLDLVELADRAATDLAELGSPPALPDALRGAADAIRTTVFAPA